MPTTQTHAWPTPELDPLLHPNKTEFEEKWPHHMEIHQQDFLNALEKIGASLTKCNPQNPTGYFCIEHKGKHFTLSYSKISKGSEIKKLAERNRMESIHEIVTTLQTYNKDLFYNTVQAHIKAKKGLQSESASVNDLIFGITCDFLKESGFRFHMD